MKLSEVIRQVIRLGEASRAYWDRELPKHHPRYPLIRAGEDSGPPPPEDAQIEAILKSLPEEQLYALILLMYVGRGDFSADQLLPAYQAMKETFPTKDLVIAQMTGKRTLADYLTDALEELDKRNIDVDHLQCTCTAAAS
jgi:hypothetical protein